MITGHEALILILLRTDQLFKLSLNALVYNKSIVDV